MKRVNWRQAASWLIDNGEGALCLYLMVAMALGVWKTGELLLSAFRFLTTG